MESRGKKIIPDVKSEYNNCKYKNGKFYILQVLSRHDSFMWTNTKSLTSKNCLFCGIFINKISS